MTELLDQCAACGKESDSLKNCSGCKSVILQSNCQKLHRKKHKHQCKQRAAELMDEALFKQPPPRKDCPICMHQLPIVEETVYKNCCGMTVCSGCVYAQMKVAEWSDTEQQRRLPNLTCPFCRLPTLLQETRQYQKIQQTNGGW